MDASLDAGALAALLGSMALLAALPSTSVMAVIAQAAAHGFRHGASVALGVVLGDLVYILVAAFGLALLLDAAAGMGPALRLLGALYLLWLGSRLWRASPVRHDGGLRPQAPSLRSGFAMGLLITLADHKAILFYLGFLPAFVDLERVRAGDVAQIAAVAILSVGGVKLAYAALADRARVLLGPRVARSINRSAALLMFGLGLYLLGAGVFFRA